MAYVLPTFNLSVHIWRNGNAVTNPPDVIALGNLTPGRRVFSGDGATVPTSLWYPIMFLLLPVGTDIRGELDTGGAMDTVEVPAGTGRYYAVQFTDDIGKGFANEHRFAILNQVGPWPHPIP